MLVPRKMKKVRIYSVKENEEAILSVLHDLGIFQVEPVSISPELVTPLPQSEAYAKLSELSRKVRDLELSLYSSDADERKLFKNVKELVAAAESLDIYDRVKLLKERETSLLATLKLLDETIKSLELIKFYNGDISYLKSSSIFSCIVLDDKETKSKLAGFKDSYLISDDSAIIVIVPREQESKLGEFAKNEKLDLIQVPMLSGKVVDALAAEVKKKEELLKEVNEIREEISKISKDNYANVAAIREQLDIELKKIDVTSKLSGTEKALILEGWVPADEFIGMKEALARTTDNQIFTEEIETDELPPTSLNNPNRIRLFQFFIRFYSLPQSTEFDPTLVFALIFPIFFGIMIGDVGYGVTILIISLWLIWRVDHTPKKSRIPKFLSRFVLMMMSKRSLKILAKAMLPGAIIAIILGVIFDEYFGFHFAYPHYEVLSSYGLRKLLLIAGYTGVAMVSLGLIFGALVNFMNGHKKEAYGKIGWLLVSYSIVILGLEIIYNNVSGLNPLRDRLALVAYPMFGVGLGVVVYSERVQALLEITTIISHILSYTRLVGILLASVGLAYVFDYLFMGSLHHSIIFIILGVVILVIGQLLNLVIAIFEPGIQGARLIYVEFFSKFYKGNGREFKPFSSPRNYTIKQFSLEPLDGHSKK